MEAKQRNARNRGLGSTGRTADSEALDRLPVWLTRGAGNPDGNRASATVATGYLPVTAFTSCFISRLEVNLMRILLQDLESGYLIGSQMAATI